MQESGEPLIGIETYRSLHELAAAFESAAVSNARIMFDDEKVYYLSDDNIFGASMQEVQDAESYFNCIYEDGYGALEHMTANNSDVFSKKQIDGIKYYYAVEDVVKDLEYRSNVIKKWKNHDKIECFFT